MVARDDQYEHLVNDKEGNVNVKRSSKNTNSDIQDSYLVDICFSYTNYVLGYNDVVAQTISYEVRLALTSLS